ncbi:MAG: FHA domain-containing protein [Blastochloris sp.]|nr:FHA domain-containing protein [Blastochloris sp.]
MANVELLAHLEQLGPKRAKGILSVQNPETGEEGSICLTEGMIVAAMTSKFKDLNAVMAMIAWDQASCLWLEGQSPPMLSCSIATDLAVFEFVQMEMEHGDTQGVLAFLEDQAEQPQATKKRKTIRLPDLSNFSIFLQMQDDGSGQNDFELREGTVLIGKGADCDIILAHSTISRRHCQLTLVDRTITLTDLGSTNGSFVNGQIVHQEFVVPGDKVTLGSVEFLVAARLRRNLSKSEMPVSAPVAPQNSATMRIPKNTKAVHWNNLKDSPAPAKPEKSLIKRFLNKKPG